MEKDSYNKLKSINEFKHILSNDSESHINRTLNSYQKSCINEQCINFPNQLSSKLEQFEKENKIEEKDNPIFKSNMKEEDISKKVKKKFDYESPISYKTSMRSNIIINKSDAKIRKTLNGNFILNLFNY